MAKRRTVEQEKAKDILKAADLRVQRGFDEYRSRREFDIGEVRTTTFAGASVALGESGRYIKNMQSMRGVEIIVGSRVLCARIGRHDWIIVGSIERSQGSTPKAGVDNIVAQPQNLAVTGQKGYSTAEWDGSHFDIAVWQMQIASASTTDDFVATHYTDNTQYDIYTDQVLPYTMYMRVRAVGPAWDYGSPTEWVVFTIQAGGTVDQTTRVTTTYTILATDDVVYCDTDGGAFTVTLPAGIEGTHYKIINCGSSDNDLTVDGDGAETVYGETEQELTDGDVIDLHYNATEGWW